MVSKTWYYKTDDEKHGPFSFVVLRELIESSEIPADVLIWQEGMSDWAKADDVAKAQTTLGVSNEGMQGTIDTSTKDTGFDGENNTLLNRYRAFLGKKNAAYYIAVFNKRDREGSSIGWNWPAFFFVHWWALYRKMYGRFFAYFGLVLIAPPLISIEYPEAGYFGWLVVMAISSVTANNGYYKHARSKINDASVVLEKENLIIERLQKTGGVLGSLYWIGILVLVFLIVGILAAVSIPAYQNYSNRAEFAELILSVVPRKTAIELAIELRDIEKVDVDGGSFGIPTDIPVTSNAHGATVRDGVITLTWMLDGSELSGITYQLILQGNSLPVQWGEGGTCASRGFC